MRVAAVPTHLPVMQCVPAGAYAIPVEGWCTRWDGRTLVVAPTTTATVGDLVITSFGPKYRGGNIAVVGGQRLYIIGSMNRIGHTLRHAAGRNDADNVVARVIGEIKSPGGSAEALALFNADNEADFNVEREAADLLDVDAYLATLDELGRISTLTIDETNGGRRSIVQCCVDEPPHEECIAIYEREAEMFRLYSAGGPAAVRKIGAACERLGRVQRFTEAGWADDPNMPASVRAALDAFRADMARYDNDGDEVAA
jgi:hypothetical protein